MATNIDSIYNNTFYDNQYKGSISSAVHFLEYLFSYYRPDSIVDFGCGVGSWLSVANDLGVSRLVGLDGAWLSQQKMLNQKIAFKEVDFTKEFDLKEQFDLAISVEVAEHFDEQFSNQFIQNICKSAPVVIFGAAIPEQGGANHVNEQYQSFWIKKFEENGYICLDIFRKKFWGYEDIEYWYKQNTFLFVSNDQIDLLPKELFNHTDFIPDIVHPTLFKKKFKRRTPDNEIDLIRDAAIVFEKYDLHMSLELMKKAQMLRPKGAFINKKLNDYKRMLSQPSSSESLE